MLTLKAKLSHTVECEEREICPRKRAHAYELVLPVVTRQWRLFEECWPLVAIYLGVFDWKVQRFCWPKGTSLECAESIYVEITEAACVCDELCRLKEDKS